MTTDGNATSGAPEAWAQKLGSAGSKAKRENPWADGVWLNAPRTSHIREDSLTVVTEKGTDFWRETFYGFIHDSGHFLAMPAPAGFTAEVRVRAEFEALYNQAGVMVRIDAHTWVKAGIEISDGRAVLSSVLTNGQSDWATADFQGDPRDFWMRASVTDGVLRLQASADGLTWPLLRLAPFPRSPSYEVGPMCCAPKREGLVVRFSDWRLGPPLGRDLHDLS